MYRNSKMQWLSSNDVTKPKLIKTFSVDFLQATQYLFLEKSDQHDQWNVLNYTFHILFIFFIPKLYLKDTTSVWKITLHKVG